MNETIREEAQKALLSILVDITCVAGRVIAKETQPTPHLWAQTARELSQVACNLNAMLTDEETEEE